MNSPDFPSLETYGDHTPSYRAAQVPLDSAFKTIFDDLSEGVLVVDAAGHRVYSNAALNDLVRGNACLPAGSSEPPSYVPADQRQKYILALRGTSSLLTLEGSGAASTWLELAPPGRARARTRVTISAFTGQRGWRFAVWLFNFDSAEPPGTGPGGPRGPYLGAATVSDHARDGFLGWYPVSAVDSLTRREKDVLQLLLDGLRVSSIARQLYLSPQTVRNHLKAIFRKVGAHSQAELLDTLRAMAQRPQTSTPMGDPGSAPLPSLTLRGDEACT